MENMWSPWRSKYIETFKDEKPEDENSCFLCDAYSDSDNDEATRVVCRGEHCFVIMNKFPYNSGHLLIAPISHTGEMEDLTAEVMNEMMLLLQKSTKILKEIYKPHGFNIGMNIGRVAGAGLPGHIHLHIVPRWNGDVNFMPVFADIKVISEDMDDAWKKLRTAFNE